MEITVRILEVLKYNFGNFRYVMIGNICLLYLLISSFFNTRTALDKRMKYEADDLTRTKIRKIVLRSAKFINYYLAFIYTLLLVQSIFLKKYTDAHLFKISDGYYMHISRASHFYSVVVIFLCVNMFVYRGIKKNKRQKLSIVWDVLILASFIILALMHYIIYRKVRFKISNNPTTK